MLAENLKIFKATREVLGIMLGYTKNINREVKFAEWADARKAMNDALDIIFVINNKRQVEIMLRQHAQNRDNNR